MSEGPFVLLVTGPAGAGKTTTADAWAASSSRPTAHLSLDTVRRFLRSGYAHPPDGWNEEVKRQHALARELCATMARRYVVAGIDCVIDDVVFPDPPLVSLSGDQAALEAFPEWDVGVYARWKDDLQDAPSTLVVLLPSLDSVQSRNAERHDDHRLTPRFTNWVYRTMVPWRLQSEFPVIDNTALTVAETVIAVNEALDPRWA